jgi:putative ABC transport system permease protein
MGIPLLHGRTFEPADQRRTRGVALINASMAAHFWQEGSAIGRRIKPVWWRDWLTIVGVVGDVHHHSLSADPGWEVYTLFGNVWGPTAMAAVIHTNGDLNVLAGSLRGAVAEVDASIPVSAIRTVPQVISRSLAQPKLFGWTMASFAGLALTLATLGIYSVIAYGVAQRRHEIGIRLALGAQPGTVRWGVLRCGLLLSLSGLSAGLILTAAASRALRSQLFNISPMDPRIYTAVAVILLAVGCLAAWIPARTAARLDPAVTLRAE